MPSCLPKSDYVPVRIVSRTRRISASASPTCHSLDGMSDEAEHDRMTYRHVVLVSIAASTQ